jgi:hypothetical protein
MKNKESQIMAVGIIHGARDIAALAERGGLG